MKKIKKILLIIIITFISIILLEYLYSQRWRLNQSVDHEEYFAVLVDGYWITNQEYYYIHSFLSFGADYDVCDLFLFNADNTMRHGICAFVSFHGKGSWSIEKQKILLNYQRGGKVFSPRLGESYQKNHDIIFLNTNFLVIDEWDENIEFPFIPRKKVFVNQK